MRRTLRVGSLRAGVTVAFFATACKSDRIASQPRTALADADVTGAYVLVAAGGRPLPALSRDGVVRLDADTLWFRSDGTGRRARYVVVTATARLLTPTGHGGPWELVPPQDSLVGYWAQDPGTRAKLWEKYQVVDRGERLISTDPDWCFAGACDFRRVR